MTTPADRATAALIETLRRRISPAHRVVPSAIGMRLAVAWAFLLVCPGAILLILGVLASADVSRQLALDTLANLGLGTPRDEARVTGVFCSHHSGTGRLPLDEHRCGVRVQDGRDVLRLQLHAGEAPRQAQAEAVVSVFGQFAVRWPAEVMWSRWWLMLPFALPLILLVPLSWASLAAIRRLSARGRAITEGDPQPADLLCRDGDKTGRGPVHWDIAYNLAGQRRFARVETEAMPIVLDAAATRGLVLAAPDGAVELLQAQGWPLTLDPETAAWLTDEAEAIRRSPRPPAPGLAAMAERRPEGAERDYAQGYDRMWQATTNPEFHAAFEQAHAAAARLGPKRTEALLQQMRACLPPPQGTA